MAGGPPAAAAGAAANPGNLQVGADPLFYGTEAVTIKHAMGAAQFLDRMNAIRLQHHAGDQAAAIIRTISNFRGEAHWWYTHVVQFFASGIDHNQFLNNWHYFTQVFKEKYELEKDEREVGTDLSDLKQTKTETAVAFGYRLLGTYQPVSKLCLAGTLARLNVNDVVERYCPEDLRLHLNDAEAHPMNHANLVNRIGTLALRAAQGGAMLRERDTTFEHVARTLARNIHNAGLRKFVRRVMMEVNKDLPALLQRIGLEEKTDNPIVTRAVNGHPVNAIEDKREQPPSEEAPGSDAEGEEDVDAIRKGARPKKKDAKKQGKKDAKPKSDNPRDYKCGYCRLDSHDLGVCRKLRAALGLSYEGPLMTGSGTAPKHPYTPRGGRGRGGRGAPRGGRGGYSGQAGEPMDTSALQHLLLEAANKLNISQQGGYEQQQEGYDQQQQQYAESISYYYPPGHQDANAHGSGNARGGI